MTEKLTSDPISYFSFTPSENHLFAINRDQSAEVFLEAADCLLDCLEDCATETAVDENSNRVWSLVYHIQAVRAIVAAAGDAIDREHGPRPPALVPTGA